MKYHFKIHKEKKGGYWAECIELSGCYTQAETKKELKENMSEALNLFLDESASSSLLYSLPKKTIIKANVEEVEVDSKIAMAFLLRRNRVLAGLTQKQVAKKLGLKNLYSYQRLENSKTSNPSLTTLKKIKVIFPKLDVALLVA